MDAEKTCKILPCVATLLAAPLLTGCKTLGPIVEDLAACKAVQEVLVEDMAVEPLFARADGACRPLSTSDLDRAVQPDEVFGDAACTLPVAYAGTTFEAFCFDNLLGTPRTEKYIGNPLAWGDLDDGVDGRLETRWTLSHGATLRVTAVDQTRDLHRPYVKQVEYRRAGDCVLGLRVYKRHPLDDALKPAIFLHGGGWKYRATGAVAGIETSAPNLTERGYVVFAPFYRLIGDSDGPEACRRADGRDILDDLEAAVDWVFENGTDFGMDPRFRDERRALFMGQSAGAHLSAHVLVHRPEMVERAILLYPPTDFRFLIQNLQPGGLYTEGFDKGRALLLDFLAQPGVDDAADLDPDDPLVVANSFPELIEAGGGPYAPVHVIHGDADDLAPVENSTRLCAALDPAATPSPAAYPGGDVNADCGAGRQLTVVAGAGHVLDLRCFTGDAARVMARIDSQLAELCPAGSRRGERRVREALERAYAELEP